MQGCYEAYKKAAEDICGISTNATIVALLKQGLDKAEDEAEATTRAWTMRRALDAAKAEMGSSSSTSLNAVVQYAPREGHRGDLVAFFGGKKVLDRHVSQKVCVENLA